MRKCKEEPRSVLKIPMTAYPDTGERADAGLYREHCLRMHESLFEDIKFVSAQRKSTNNVFLSIHTFLMSAIGYAMVHASDALNGENSMSFLVILSVVFLLSGVGFLLSMKWKRIIGAYEIRNKQKFLRLNEMEEQLPFAPYQVTQPDEERATFPALEQSIPKSFALIYFVLWILAVILLLIEYT